MDLYLIRHGESTNNRGDLPRVADPPLTERGEEQARRVGEALVGEGITCLYCSPMLRALQTAAIIGERLGLAPHVFVGLHEWGGMWEEREGMLVQLPGMNRAQMQQVCPHVVLPDGVTEQGWWFKDWQGDEGMIRQVQENAAAFLRHLGAHHPGEEERVAAVAHGGQGSSIIEAALGLPPATHNGWYYERFSQHNCALSKLMLTPERTKLRFLNRVGHLPLEMIT